MNKLKNLSVYILLTFTFVCCKKENYDNFTGRFIGTFTVKYTNNTTFTGSTIVDFLDKGEYNCTGNTNFIPAGGSGTFTKTYNKIAFKDINLWTANFDGNLILNGEYDYSFDGKNLKISTFKNNAGQYEYNLIKQ